MARVVEVVVGDQADRRYRGGSARQRNSRLPWILRRHCDVSGARVTRSTDRRKCAARAAYIVTLLVMCLFHFPNKSIAATANVEISFDVSNIAMDSSANTVRNGKLFPFNEAVNSIAKRIRSQTFLGRSTYVTWKVENYEVNPSLFSSVTGGYHLFDITWYRTGIDAKYRDKNGRWASVQFMPTGFNFKPRSKAAVVGQEDIDILISPTVCPKRLCIGGRGELLGEYNEITDAQLRGEDYDVSLFRYPVTKAVYLMAKDDNLVGQKISMSGRFLLGDSVITTRRSSFWYPYDEYSMEFLYKSYFPSNAAFKLDEIEDLDSNNKKQEYWDVQEGGILSPRFDLLRIDRTNRLWSILFIIIPLALSAIERNSPQPTWVRALVYAVSAAFLYGTLPHSVRHISNVNILNLASWGLLVVAVIFSEVVHVNAVLRVRRKARQRAERSVRGRRRRPPRK